MKYKARTENQAKIIVGMDKVFEKLIESKRKINGKIVILKDNKIVRVKP